MKTLYEAPSLGGELHLEARRAGAHNHLFLGNRSAELLTSRMHVLASLWVEGILGNVAGLQRGRNGEFCASDLTGAWEASNFPEEDFWPTSVRLLPFAQLPACSVMRQAEIL